MSTSSLIRQAYSYTRSSDTRDKLRYEYEAKKFLRNNQGTDFLEPLTFFLGILEQSDPVLFPYMSNTQKEQILRDLQVTYLLLLAEKKYEEQHQKTENAAEYDKKLKKCQRLIDAIQYKKICAEQHIQAAPEQGCQSDEQPVAYCGLAFGQAFAEQMVAVTDRTTKTIKENMGWVNEKRLYWVWTSSLIKTMLELLPDGFFYGDQAKQIVKMPDLYTGTMSWGLYYFRFALNLGLLLKHTIRGPWMEKRDGSGYMEEANTPWTERFSTQWAQRKFSLLNDFFWATGNLLCFFWLCGGGVAGAWGDLLTVALLVFDIALAVWDYEEQKTAHNKAMLDYETAIIHLKSQIDAIKLRNEKDKSRETELMTQLAALERAKKQCQREWDYQNINLATSVAYAVGLMLAFVLLTAPFIPLPAATIAAMSVAGAVLCFALSIIANAIKGGLEIHKSKMISKELKADYAQSVRRFRELQHTDPDMDDNAKKLLFLEIKKLMAETEYQEKIVNQQIMNLIRSVLIESLVPALVFTSFVFLPLGTGLAILAAAVALALVSHVLINKICTPEKEELKEFNQAEYESFCQNPEHWKKATGKSQAFFQSYSEGTSSEDSDYGLDSLCSSSTNSPLPSNSL